MANIVIAASLPGTAYYNVTGSPGSQDHNVLRNATSGTATTAVKQSTYDWNYGAVSSTFDLWQTALRFDLSALPAGAIISSGSVGLVMSAGALATSWGGSTDFRLIGPGNANAALHVDDYREMNTAPAALTADFAYNLTSGSLALTATGLTHVGNWRASDDAVKFMVASVAMIDDYDPGGITDRFLRTNVYTSATLTLNYELPAVMLGCNF